MKNQRRLLLAGIWVLILASGCDNNATFTKIPFNFNHTQVISAVPAISDGNSWRPMCGLELDNGAMVAPEGILLNVSYISYKRKDDDLDQSLRPDDRVNDRDIGGERSEDIDLTNAANIGITVDCIDTLPDSDQPPSGTLTDTTDKCQGAEPDSVGVGAPFYVPFTDDRAKRHNVIVLLDQSGSMTGLVDGGTYLEGAMGDIDLSSDFLGLASDYYDLRKVAAKSFINRLNDDDRLGVVAFGESIETSDHLTVACPTATGSSIAEDLDECFGTNHDLWTGVDGIDGLGTGGGRSNLWKGIETVYDYLMNIAEDEGGSRHIVVVTDGPDTCDSDSQAFAGCTQSACSTTTHQDVLNKIEVDRLKVNGDHVQIHFVQFESRGYTGRDTRQMEVACASQGHYQYINSEDNPAEQLTPLQDALETALLNVRHSLMGYWQIPITIAALEKHGAPPTYTPVGSRYAISGMITVRASSNMVSGSDEPQEFGAGGMGAGAQNSTFWDRRPSIRKPCMGAVDCGGLDSSQDDCNIICSTETLICPQGADGVTAPNNATQCTMDEGSSGICCGGICQSPLSPCALCN
jgi:hypothetical protein